MDFLAKRGRFCRHSLSYVKKTNEVAAKKTHKDIKRYPTWRIKTISKKRLSQNTMFLIIFSQCFSVCRNCNLYESLYNNKLKKYTECYRLYAELHRVLLRQLL